jgi:sirohydrochlorin cobaltochelatase
MLEGVTIMNRKLKKMLVLSLCLASMTGFATVTQAAYTLNPEVKDATPALKQAAEIGVRTYFNHNRMGEANKDAIMVMSFGTTFKDSREKTIDATVAAIQAAHPNVKVVKAFTSHIIVDRIKAKEGLTIPTPEQAMAQLKAEGYNRVAITSLDLFPGMEYAYDTAVFDLYKERF